MPQHNIQHNPTPEPATDPQHAGENPTKHTPGPWVVWDGHASVFANNDGENNPRSISGSQICECEPDDLFPDGVDGLDEDDVEELAEETAVANARL